jgi:hypothetical protein
VSRPLDIAFLVEGDPIPKGNHQAFPIARGRCTECKPGRPCRGRSCFGGTIVGTVVTDKGAGELEAWEQLAGVRAASARNLAGQARVAKPGAVEASIVFVLRRPAGHWTSSGALTAAGRAQPMPTVKPDFDKLTRALADGMTSAIAEDDAQIVVAPIALVYALWRGWTGACVRARQMSTYPPWVVEQLTAAGVWSASTQGVLI